MHRTLSDLAVTPGLIVCRELYSSAIERAHWTSQQLNANQVTPEKLIILLREETARSGAAALYVSLLGFFLIAMSQKKEEDFIVPVSYT